MQGHARTHSEPFVATSVHMEGFHVHLGWVIPCLCVEICDEDESVSGSYVHFSSALFSHHPSCSCLIGSYEGRDSFFEHL